MVGLFWKKNILITSIKNQMQIVTCKLENIYYNKCFFFKINNLPQCTAHEALRIAAYEAVGLAAFSRFLVFSGSNLISKNI